MDFTLPRGALGKVYRQFIFLSLATAVLKSHCEAIKKGIFLFKSEVLHQITFLELSWNAVCSLHSHCGTQPVIQWWVAQWQLLNWDNSMFSDEQNYKSQRWKTMWGYLGAISLFALSVLMMNQPFSLSGGPAGHRQTKRGWNVAGVGKQGMREWKDNYSHCMGGEWTPRNIKESLRSCVHH